MTVEDAIEQYGPLVLDIAWKITRCEEDARDIFQDTFLKYHQQASGSIRSPKAWLCQTTIRAAVKRQRARRRCDDLHENTGVTWDAGTLADVEQEQLAGQVWERIHVLPERQRDACVLRFHQGLPYGEIGQVLDCSPGAARAAVFQALRRLRGWLCEDSEPRLAEGNG